MIKETSNKVLEYNKHVLVYTKQPGLNTQKVKLTELEKLNPQLEWDTLVYLSPKLRDEAG